MVDSFVYEWKKEKKKYLRKRKELRRNLKKANELIRINDK